tara:strand:+ start:419 stop:1081 length:663 start_codon:yes stop_codon:yes gene_type:complete
LISWIKGEIIDTWIQTKKFYVLINCQGLGYEVQTLELLKKELDKNKIVLWIHQIKREDSDLLFGFKDKDKRDFFRDLLRVKGVGPQIGMSLLNKYDLTQIFNSVINKDTALFNSVPGIGEKMTERLFLELKNKIKVNSEIIEDFTEKPNNSLFKKEFKFLMDDLDLALKSLSYSSKDRKKAANLILTKFNQSNISKQKILNSFTFELLLKESLDFLEKNQ